MRTNAVATAWVREVAENQSAVRCAPIIESAEQLTALEVKNAKHHCNCMSWFVGVDRARRRTERRRTERLLINSQRSRGRAPEVDYGRRQQNLGGCVGTPEK